MQDILLRYLAIAHSFVVDAEALALERLELEKKADHELAKVLAQLQISQEGVLAPAMQLALGRVGLSSELLTLPDRGADINTGLGSIDRPTVILALSRYCLGIYALRHSIFPYQVISLLMWEGQKVLNQLKVVPADVTAVKYSSGWLRQVAKMYQVELPDFMK